MNWKYMIAGLLGLLYLGYLVLSRQKGESPQGMINLSYDICLDTAAGYQELKNDTLERVHYTRSFWIDTAHQFFSKSVVGPSNDTLFVSAFNKATFRSVHEAMETAGFETIVRKTSQDDGFRYQFFFSRKGSGHYFFRQLVSDPKFDAIILIDQMSRDSSALRQRYEAASLTKHLQKCL